MGGVGKGTGWCAPGWGEGRGVNLAGVRGVCGQGGMWTWWLGEGLVVGLCVEGQGGHERGPAGWNGAACWGAVARWQRATGCLAACHALRVPHGSTRVSAAGS